MYEKLVTELNTILSNEYRRLGFRLDGLDIIHNPENIGAYIRGQIMCPCGGMEYFQFHVDVHEFRAREVSHLILMNTASYEHLERDVREGKLPASALEGAVYDGGLRA